MSNSSDRVVLVQVSDPHFSKHLRNRSVDIIHGYRAHDHLLAQALPVGIDDALEQSGASRDDATLVVSGDLTVCGTAGQFRRARQFLGSVLPANRDRDTWGLGWPADRRHQTPGNHDHWDGRMPPYTGLRRPRAFNPGLFPPSRKLSSPPPFVHHPWKLSAPLRAGRLIVEVYGIDTLSGFAPTDTNLAARGRIRPGHLVEIEKLLPPPEFDRNRVRVLVMHHPLVASDRGLEDLDHTSLKHVSAFLRRHHFAVVLAGHLHAFLPRPVDVADGAETGQVLELRCPSTLQGEPKSSVQGFLLHEVRLAPAPSWTTTPWLWQWSQANGKHQTSRFVGDEPVVSRLPTVSGEQNWALVPPAP